MTATASPAVFALLLLSLWPVPATADVRVVGLERNLEAAVRSGLPLVGERCDAPESRVRRQFRRAPDEIRKTLEVFGYYAPVIEQSLEQGDECWIARFDVTAGPRVRLRDVSVDLRGAGADDAELVREAGRNPFGRGEGLDQSAYEDFKSTLVSAARQRGYFDAAWSTARIDVWPDDLAADITLELDSGERYRFGEIRFEQDVLYERLTPRFVEFEPGDPYHADRISDLYSALLLSGYFEGVDVRTTPRQDGTVDVVVALTAADPRTATIGVGFATDLGPKLLLGYVNRRRNQRGHQFEFSSNLSEVLGEATASYRIPMRDAHDDWRSFDTGYRYEEPESAESRQFRVGVKEIRRRGSRGWLETRYIDYSRERFTIGDQPAVTTDLILPGLNWTHRTRELPVRPLRAHFMSFGLSGTSEWLGSDTAFAQFETQGRLIRPLWRGARVLVRLEVGTTLKDDFDELPFSVRYFAGGDYSVRGYDYKSLGPTDESGAVTGGSHQLTGSVEIDQRIRGNWSVAVFADSGNAFNDWDEIRLKTGVGAGLRWYSPLGPVRFAVGVPLDKDAPDDFRIHITLGPDL